jgi:putative ABC transport system permease protein
MAILGAIGLSRRQLTAAVATLGATVGLLAAVVGVPLGLLAGKWLWTAHADRIGLSPSIALPTGIAVAVGAATVTLTCMIALAAGWGALRTRLATALRSE